MGVLCRDCSDRQCHDKGTEQEPIEMQCPCCNGEGCSECQMGMIQIIGCPNRYCSTVADVVRMSEFFDKGLPPVAGGLLDQSAWFLDAVSVLRRDEAEMRRNQ
jgi:hypothetical protein